MILNEIQPEDLKGDFYKIRYDKTCGAVYVAGYTSGTVKIGSTAHPMNRFMQLKYSSVEYAGGELEKFALSNPVREYTKLEKDIHKRFEGECIRKELFGIDFKQAVKIINSEFQNFDKLNIKSDREFKSLQRFNEMVNMYGSAEMIPIREIKDIATLAFEDGMNAEEKIIEYERKEGCGTS